MIHELLLALSGYPGTIFTWNKRTGLQVNSKHGDGARKYVSVKYMALHFIFLTLNICSDYCLWFARSHTLVRA